MLKLAITAKLTSSPEPSIFAQKFALNISGKLVFRHVKIKKIIAELDHSDLLSVKTSVCSNVSISRKHKCIFIILHKVPELNYIKFMQMD